MGLIRCNFSLQPESNCIYGGHLQLDSVWPTAIFRTIIINFKQFWFLELGFALSTLQGRNFSLGKHQIHQYEQISH